MHGAHRFLGGGEDFTSVDKLLMRWPSLSPMPLPRRMIFCVLRDIEMLNRRHARAQWSHVLLVHSRQGSWQLHALLWWRPTATSL